MKNNSFFYNLLVSPNFKISAIAASCLVVIFSSYLPAVAQREDGLLDPSRLDVLKRSRPNTYSPPGPNNPNSFPNTDNNSTPFPVNSSTYSETDYTLGPGDQIRLDIFQVEEYSGEYPVLVDGSISLPLIGNLKVTGLTLAETSDLVASKYAAYLKRPVITVGLVTPRPMQITASGEVDNPGSYEFDVTQTRSFPTAVEVLQQAGGITTLADIRNIQIIRKIKNREETYLVNAWNLIDQGKIDDLRLRDGDTIFIPTVEQVSLEEIDRLAAAGATFGIGDPIKVALVGEVYRPGTYTVNTQAGPNDQGQGEALPPRLSDALALSGGIKPLANVRDIEIRRETWDGKEKTIAVDLWSMLQDGDETQDVILQKGDSIIIPRADTLAAEESESLAAASFSPGAIRINVVGEVTNPGTIEVPPNTPLNQGILAAGGFNRSRANTGSVELVRLNPNGTVSKRNIKVDFANDIDEENNPTLRQNDVIVVKRSGAAGIGDALGTVLRPLTAPLSLLRFLGF
ncbi:MAG: SLBB domain-containing protein [Xenococcaceae cyanobacterium MO_188.B32]|nr:SLBB domain-containing protein [Xenococcaceae cyanobacterium MO_188.B32]